MREFNSFGEMNKEDFRALQMKSLDILLYFDFFCKKYNLRYYLAGGTLLGAIRHKGFIPWDEDIDVHMPRPDYEKITKLWPQFADTEKYTFCRTDFKNNFHHCASSIIDNDTTYVMKRNQCEDIPQGILIDIIPIDGCPRSKIRQCIQVFWAILFAIYNVQRLPENQGGKGMRIGTQIALEIIHKPLWRYKIWKRAEKEMSKYDFDTSYYVKELIAPLKSMKYCYLREHFTDVSLVNFENHVFPSHYYSKEYLKNAYGNYMKLPPPEKRIPKGNAVYLNLDMGYKQFKGIYYCKN